MTLLEIVKKIKNIAEAQPNVNSSYYGDIYTINAEQDVKYSTVVVTNDIHREIDGYRHYTFNIFYVDRLTDDGGNKLEVQSVGMDVLGNIIHRIEHEEWADVDNIEYHIFNERFNDLCAGAYARITVVLPVNSCNQEGYEYPI